MSVDLKYIVVEYFPHLMDGDELRPARIDGHYRDYEDAKEIAEFWAENPKSPDSRIVVAEVSFEAKAPIRWKGGA